MPDGDPRGTASAGGGGGSRSTWNWRAPFRMLRPKGKLRPNPNVLFDDSAISEQLRATRSQFDAFFLALQVGAVEAGEAISDNLTNAFQRMWEEGATIGGLFNAMFEGIASSATDAIGQMAKSKATENFIRAAEEAAQAVASLFTPGRQAETAGHIKAAGMFAAVGSAWAALAGGGAAASNAIRGGGGGGHGGYKADGRRAVDESRVKGPEVHVYIDPLDPFKPAYQDSVYAAESLARERYGDNARVTVHPRRG
jgi:hypothetical protein